MAHPLLDMLRNLKLTNAKIESGIQVRQEMLQQRAVVENGEQVSAATPQGLESNMKSLPDFMKPGNAGPINRVIWPFWFSFSSAEIAPNQSTLGTFTVTQEAAFIWMSMSKAIFLRTSAPDVLSYIDPELNTGVGTTPGLSFALRDAQSSRLFTQNPLLVDHIGRPQYPTVLPTPQIMLPNSTIEVEWFNNHATDTYRPYLVFFGYRVRWDGSQDLLSTIYG